MQTPSLLYIKKQDWRFRKANHLVATKYPVMAAIGLPDNNYTTVALSRYVTAVASEKNNNYQADGINRWMQMGKDGQKSIRPTTRLI